LPERGQGKGGGVDQGQGLAYIEDQAADWRLSPDNRAVRIRGGAGGQRRGAAQGKDQSAWIITGQEIAIRKIDSLRGILTSLPERYGSS